MSDTTNGKEQSTDTKSQETETKAETNVTPDEEVAYWKGQTQDLKAQLADVSKQLKELQKQHQSTETKSKDDMIASLSAKLEETEKQLRDMQAAEVRTRKLQAVKSHARELGMKDTYLNDDVLSSFVKLDAIDPDNPVTVKMMLGETKTRFPDFFGRPSAKMQAPNRLSSDAGAGLDALKDQMDQAFETALKTKKRADEVRYGQLKREYEQAKAQFGGR